MTIPRLEGYIQVKRRLAARQAGAVHTKNRPGGEGQFLPPEHRSLISTALLLTSVSIRDSVTSQKGDKDHA